MDTAPRLREVNRIDLTSVGGEDRFLVEVDGAIRYYAVRRSEDPAQSLPAGYWRLFVQDSDEMMIVEAMYDASTMMHKIQNGLYDPTGSDL